MTTFADTYGQVDNPAKLAQGESWAHSCPWQFVSPPRCTMVTQGGPGGLAAHVDIVHGGELPPDPYAEAGRKAARRRPGAG